MYVEPRVRKKYSILLKVVKCCFINEAYAMKKYGCGSNIPELKGMGIQLWELVRVFHKCDQWVKRHFNAWCLWSCQQNVALAVFSCKLFSCELYGGAAPCPMLLVLLLAACSKPSSCEGHNLSKRLLQFSAWWCELGTRLVSASGRASPGQGVSAWMEEMSLACCEEQHWCVGNDKKRLGR